ncbi:MAG: type II secretion system F family protein [Planctomycetales bacterium]|nr:type II secretion system F family protein [Planctomycetales bacterium]
MADSPSPREPHRPPANVPLDQTLATLAAAGLPLDRGLAALAAETSNRRDALWLTNAAERLARGESTEAVLSAATAGSNDHLRSLVRGGLESGHLVEVLTGRMQQALAIDDLRRRVRTTLAYPVTLLLLVAVLAVFVLTYVTPPVADVMTDFELELPPSTALLIWVSDHCLALSVLAVGIPLAAYALLRVTGQIWIWHRMRWSLPLLGPIWRWSALCEWARLLEPLVAQQVPLDQALRHLLAALHDQGLVHTCRSMADDVAAGQSLAQVVRGSGAFPESVQQWIDWGGENDSLAEACEGIVALCEGQLRLRATLLEIVLPPLTLLTVGGLALGLINAMFSPLVKLISSLT